jgi:D-serine deaminase-like pyridoxal phosphate-dependent protein
MNSSDGLQTPLLLLDQSILLRNLERMRGHVRALGAQLRPHAKTAKSIEVLRRALGEGPRAIAVSTLREAEYFVRNGVRDILYAVGIVPAKLPQVADLIRRGADLTVVLDSLEAASAVERFAAAAAIEVPVLIEVDVDGHRSGVEPASQLLIALGHQLAAARGKVRLRGVMTHAGSSYECRTIASLQDVAELERAQATLAANRLRAGGVSVDVVSVGSTPTATFARRLDGVTEVRAGVYMFNDLVMAGLGVCTLEDIALSVLVTVIGHQPRRGWIITDGGWTALSRDRGTASQPLDQGYGVVRDVLGGSLPEDLIVVSTNQEHGILARRDGQSPQLERYPIGSQLRILPNHACATASQHACYHVVEHSSVKPLECWPRFSGW